MRSHLFGLPSPRNLGFVPTVLIIIVPNVIVYGYQLVHSNAYAGFVSIDFGPAYIARLVASLVPLAVLMPMRANRPSDHFLMLYGLFVMLSYSMFHDVGGKVDTLDYMVRYGILLAPMLMIRFGRGLIFNFDLPSALTARQLELGISAIGMSVALIVLTKGPSSAGFGLNDVYVRRLEGREIFAPGSMLAYASGMVVNGLAPFLAFIAGAQGRIRPLLVSSFFATVFFFTVGLKSPLAFVLLAYLVGRGSREFDSRTVLTATILATLAGFVAFFVEAGIYEFSITAEFFFRRVFVVPAQVMQQYFDMIFHNANLRWSALSGVDAPLGVSYLIGSMYHLNDATNANTNTFVAALGARGVPGLFMNLGLVWLVFTWLDSMYLKARNQGYLYVGLVFSLLLTEQAASVALVSSGIGMLIVLLGISKARAEGKRTTKEAGVT